jgi:hypothetical protein
MWIVLLDTSEMSDPYGPFSDLKAAAEFLRAAEDRNRAGQIAQLFAPEEFAAEFEEDAQP